MVLLWWIDGNPVHFLDGGWNGSKWGNQKNRQTRKKGTSSNLHQTIQQRNAAVDRHDQLRQTFSLCQSTWFQKYYVKIILGLVDMALVNAYIHYKLVNKKECRYGKIWLYGVVGECFDNDGLGKLCELSVESATTNLSGVTSKKINHFERTPALVGKNPNKSNKWRNMSRKQLIGHVSHIRSENLWIIGTKKMDLHAKSAGLRKEKEVDVSCHLH
jgi:hypothetical protein